MIIYDAVSSIGRSGNPLTFAHVVGNHSKRILVVCVGAFKTGSSCSATGVTWNGTAMTQISSNGNVERHYSIWYLLNPEVGTHNIVVSINGGNAVAGGVSFYNVRQVAPTVSTGSGTNTTINCPITPLGSRATLVAACETGDRSDPPYSNDTGIYSASWSDTWKFGCAAGYKMNLSGASAATSFTTPNAGYNYGVISIEAVTNGALFARGRTNLLSRH
jgi:hypothetical protein